jgi:hypothetical protein
LHPKKNQPDYGIKVGLKETKMLIKFRDKGLNVQALQRYLADQNFYKGRIDNDFGEATLAAVIAFQQKNDLIPDGIVGDLTWGALIRTPRERRALRPQDFSLAAEKLGVELAAVYAVTSVESAGRGFLPSGHPVVLFERHHFFKNIAPEKIALAQRYTNLYNKNAGGYLGGEAEVARYTQAWRVDPIAANLSTSWGLFQIMGFNFKAAGFDRVSDFVAAMCVSEGEQLKAFANFVMHNKTMHKALKNKDWAAFAKAYNGQKYSQNKYDFKLKTAYDHFKTLYPSPAQPQPQPKDSEHD